MPDLLAALAASDLASAVRSSRWLYAGINTAHVLGLALLVGAILPLDLRLIGFWRDERQATLIRVLVPVAAFGLLLALASGGLLFAARAPEYAVLPLFRVKILLVAVGSFSALALHLRYGLWLQAVAPASLRRAGALSLLCWLGALLSGRLIAFAGG